MDKPTLSEVTDKLFPDLVEYARYSYAKLFFLKHSNLAFLVFADGEYQLRWIW